MSGLYLLNELTTMPKVFKKFAKQKIMAVLVLSSLKTYDDIFFECFDAPVSFCLFQSLQK